MRFWTVTGDPVPKGRPRVSVVGGFARMYTPAKTKKWEDRAEKIFRLNPQGDMECGPLKVIVDVYFKRPARLPKKGAAQYNHITRADLDNCIKAVIDAMQNAELMQDDKQVVRITASKWYTSSDDPARVEVSMQSIGSML